MKWITCDRCGKTIEYKDKFRLTFDMIPIRFGFYGLDDNEYHYYDVCEECGRNLMNWINNGKESN